MREKNPFPDERLIAFVTTASCIVRKWDAVTPLADGPIGPLSISRYLWKDNGYEPRVDVRLAYTPELLRVLFHVYESEPLVRYRKTNENVYEDSCVEFFLQPVPDADDRYLNFELNAAGTLLLGYGSGRGDRIRLTDADPALFSIRSATGLSDPVSGDVYWRLALAIPAAFIQSRFPSFKLESGAVMRGNFYKCGDETPFPHYGCWSLVRSETPEFHRSADFGTIVLE